MNTHVGIQKLSKQTLERLETGSRVTFHMFFTQKEPKKANQTNKAMASKVGGNFVYIWKQVSPEFLKLFQSDLYCIQNKGEVIYTISGKKKTTTKQQIRKDLLSSIIVGRGGII